MREDLLSEAEAELEQIRADDEKEEIRRNQMIRDRHPDIYALVEKRKTLIFGNIRGILLGNDSTEDLAAEMETVSSEIRKKLEGCSLPPDFLSPVYRCPVCKDQGRTGDTVKQPCECLKKIYRKKLRQKTGLSGSDAGSFGSYNLNLFSNETIPGKNYSQRELMDMCRRVCEKWADDYPDSATRDLLLTGKSGLGKTFLLQAMTDRLIERDKNVLMVSAFRLFETARKSYFTGEGGMDELLNTDVLMIDDLGSEPLMQSITVEQLFNLLNERQAGGRSTIVSTNLDINEFRARYTERIASRLTDRRYSRVIPLEGKDIRTDGFKKE